MPQAEVARDHEGHQVDFGAQRKTDQERRKARVFGPAVGKQQAAAGGNHKNDRGDGRREHPVNQPADEKAAEDDPDANDRRHPRRGGRVEPGIPQHWHQMHHQRRGAGRDRNETAGQRPEYAAAQRLAAAVIVRVGRRERVVMGRGCAQTDRHQQPWHQRKPGQQAKAVAPVVGGNLVAQKRRQQQGGGTGPGQRDAQRKASRVLETGGDCAGVEDGRGATAQHRGEQETAVEIRQRAVQLAQ